MKTKQIDKLPEVIFTERENGIKFAEGYEPFAEKNAKAREYLKNIKLPPR